MEPQPGCWRMTIDSFIEQAGADWERAVEIKFIHSSGPGGQNVNKVATAAQLRFDPKGAGLSQAQIARLKIIAPGRFNREGLLVLTAREHRSQVLNREEAVRRLKELVARALAPPPRPRRATRPTKRAVEKRLEDKKRLGRRKNGRNRVLVASDE